MCNSIVMPQNHVTLTKAGSAKEANGSSNASRKGKQQSKRIKQAGSTARPTFKRERVRLASWLSQLSAWEIERLIMPMQRLSFLDWPAAMLGASISGEAILPLFASFYWAFDQYKCFAGIWLVPVGEIANGCVKWLSMRGRPAWEDERVHLRSWSVESSFPSSHAQLAASIWTWMVLSSSHADAVSAAPSAAAAAAYVMLVAASRVQEGLHYPSDVAVGMLLGTLSSVLYARWLLPALLSRGSQISSDMHLLVALSIPGFIAALALGLSFSRAQRSAGRDPEHWRSNACRGRHAAKEFDPRGLALGGYTGMLGVLAGLAVGGVGKRYTPMEYPATARALVLRILIGNAGLLTLFELVAAITPRRPLLLYTSLRFVKYMLVPIYILLIAPQLFSSIEI